jgi:hypothetical protein
MGMITKGMGVIRKELLKKSKKFPGPKSDKQLQKKVDTRIRRGKTVPGRKGVIGQGDIDVHARIGRTYRYRNLKALQLREDRKGRK